MFSLSKKDEANLLSILDSISKIEKYTQDISNEDNAGATSESVGASVKWSFAYQMSVQHSILLSTGLR